MKQKAPGRNFIMIVSIFLVISLIGNVFNLIANVTVLNQMKNGTLSAEMQAIVDKQGLTQQDFMVVIVLTVILVVINAVAGILGLINCNKIEKANICMGCGIALIAFQLVNAGYGAVTAGFGVVNIVGLVVALIIPLLYFWGALKNRQAMLDSQNC